MKCPKCGGKATQDEVDVGPGCIATSPWGCEACRWVYGDDDPRQEDLSDDSPQDEGDA